MNSVQIMQSILKSDQQKGSLEMTVKPGQIVHGRVEKLYPNQTALLKIGSMKLYARISFDLEVMKPYWFEAQSSQDGELRLNVLHTEHPGGKENDVRSSLLTKFKLPESDINQRLVSFLLTKKLAFSGEHLILASKWLSTQFNLEKGLNALEIMIKKDLPPTLQTFQALVDFQNTDSLAKQMNQILMGLNDSKVTETKSIQQLKLILSEIVGEITKDQIQKVVYEIAKLWVSPKSTVTEQNASFRLLQKLELLPGNQSDAHITVMKQHHQKGKIAFGAEGLNNRNGAFLADVFAQTISNEKLIKLKVRLSDFAHNHALYLDAEETSLFKQVRSQVIPHTFSLSEGAEVKQLFKQMVTSLGLEYEWGLTKLGKEGVHGIDSLKPLLMKAMSELGAEGRQLEPLLNRITGLQLISQETNGPIQQLFMQFPLLLSSNLSDVTLQWSGQKRNDGQIDSNFCRILFYLNLENIEQTIIDMNIQNRIIHITIINETNGIDSTVMSQQLQLKDQLSSLDYILSTVKVVASSIKENKRGRSETFQSMFVQDSYQGVDLKA